MVKRASGEASGHVKYCLRLFSISPRTESEITLKLKARGCVGEEAGRIIEFLKKERLLDDLAFAREWIASRIRSNPRGREALEYELRKKGVQAAVIDEAFSGMGSGFDEKEMAIRLGRKKMTESSVLNAKDRKAKLWRYLAGKGFGAEVVEEVVRAILGDGE